MATDRTESKIPMYVLTQEQINQIAAVAGKEAVQTFRAEQVKAEKKRAREENKVKKKSIRNSIKAYQSQNS